MAHYGYCFALNRLRFEAHLGFYDAERAGLQPIEVSLKLYFPKAPRCAADDHALFIDYAGLTEQLANTIAAREFRLIEYMAQALFDQTRAYVTAHGDEEIKIWLRLTKCKPPVLYLQEGASFTLSDMPADASFVQS